MGKGAADLARADQCNTITRHEDPLPFGCPFLVPRANINAWFG
jgi:hypothetical protein